MKILSLVTKLGALAGSLEIIDKVSKSESAQKAAIIATKTGKKMVGKVTRTDEIGNTIFKYNKRKLSKMYSKDKISEKVYDYLISEQKNLHHFAKDTKNIEKLFEAMIRVKDDKKLMKIIRKYEKIRDKYMAT
ncbi:MAG: hypothetical protein JJE17_11290 [Peptostreptococcaceae bacterium]|nr:hypothetical protein [Peptostreptococcaceae bacterium]